jgi:hypothetical protein
VIALALRYWKYAAGALVLAAIWFAIHHYGHVKYQAGAADMKALWAAAEKQAYDEHQKRLKEANDAYQASELSLQAQLATALATPATRTIRVPVASLCKQPSPGNAEVPGTGDSSAESVVVDDPGYGQFRQWLLKFSAAPVDGG